MNIARKAILWLLLLGSIICLALFLTNTTTVDGETVYPLTDFFLYWAYGVVLVGVVAFVLFALFKFATDFKSMVGSLVSIVLVGGLFAVCAMLGSDEAPEGMVYNYSVNISTAQADSTIAHIYTQEPIMLGNEEARDLNTQNLASISKPIDKDNVEKALNNAQSRVNNEEFYEFGNSSDITVSVKRDGAAYSSNGEYKHVSSFWLVAIDTWLYAVYALIGLTILCIGLFYVYNLVKK